MENKKSFQTSKFDRKLWNKLQVIIKNTWWTKAENVSLEKYIKNLVMNKKHFEIETQNMVTYNILD